MTERRSHWDFDLVEAVKAGSTKYGAGTVDSAYAAIAAVEDWEAQRGYVSSAVYHGHVDHANAAIRRVRELHHPIPGFNGSLWCSAHCEATADGDPTHYPCATIRALDLLPPLIDPDCRDGKHSSCVGGPCECPCHELAAP